MPRDKEKDKDKDKDLAYVFADHHAGGGYPTRGIDDSFYSLLQITEMAVAARIPWVISLGDAVDAARTHADAPVPLKNLLKTLPRNGVKFGYIDGNHDKRNISWLHDDEFYHLDDRPLRLGEVTWMGLDFRPRPQLLEALSLLPQGVTGLFMHQAWSELMHFEDVPQVGIPDLPAQVQYVLTGDYHGDCVIESYHDSGRLVHFGNPGSTSVQEIREPGEKYFLALTDNPQRPFRKMPLKTRPLLRVAGIHSEADVEGLLGGARALVEAAQARSDEMGLPEDLCKPLLHVTHSAGLNALPRRLEKVLRGAAHLFFTELVPEQVSLPLVSVPLEKGVAATPLALLGEVLPLDDEDDPLAGEANALAQRLLYATDAAAVRQEARKWLEEQVGGK